MHNIIIGSSPYSAPKNELYMCTVISSPGSVVLKICYEPMDASCMQHWKAGRELQPRDEAIKSVVLLILMGIAITFLGWSCSNRSDYLSSASSNLFIYRIVLFFFPVTPIIQLVRREPLLLKIQQEWYEIWSTTGQCTQRLMRNTARTSWYFQGT